MGASTAEVMQHGETTGQWVLLACVDQSFPAEAVQEATHRAAGGGVYVLSAARIYGSPFGLPHPSLFPSKREREAHKATVANAVRACEQHGVQARGEVMATRHAARMIARRARQHGCAEIVVSADPRPRFARLSWAGEPYILCRRSQVPVKIVVEER